MKTTINKTSLSIEQNIENIYNNPDYYAHLNRYLYTRQKVLEIFKKKKVINLLDIGCGKDAYLLRCLFHNFFPSTQHKINYIGIDVRDSALKSLQDYWNQRHTERFSIKFINNNYIENNISGIFDLITCFEVIEHFDKVYIDSFIKNILKNMDKNSLLLLSTPNYDGINKANNHIHEYTFIELKEILQQYFIIQDVIGTFINLKDIPEYSKNDKSFVWAPLFAKIVFAAKYPEKARNCLWELRIK